MLQASNDTSFIFGFGSVLRYQFVQRPIWIVRTCGSCLCRESLDCDWFTNDYDVTDVIDIWTLPTSPVCKLVELIRGKTNKQTKKPHTTLTRTVVLLNKEISRPPTIQLKGSCPNLSCFDLFHKAELHPAGVTRSADHMEQLRKEKTDFVGVGRRGLLRRTGGGDNAFNRRCFRNIMGIENWSDQWHNLQNDGIYMLL